MDQHDSQKPNRTTTRPNSSFHSLVLVELGLVRVLVLALAEE
jgi:hypothetical protein